MPLKLVCERGDKILIRNPFTPENPITLEVARIGDKHVPGRKVELTLEGDQIFQFELVKRGMS
jgi:hypothetical protein